MRAASAWPGIGSKDAGACKRPSVVRRFSVLAEIQPFDLLFLWDAETNGLVDHEEEEKAHDEAVRIGRAYAGKLHQDLVAAREDVVAVFQELLGAEDARQEGADRSAHAVNAEDIE